MISHNQLIGSLSINARAKRAGCDREGIVGWLALDAGSVTPQYTRGFGLM
jgi:hypothetical protein